MGILVWGSGLQLICERRGAIRKNISCRFTSPLFGSTDHVIIIIFIIIVIITFTIITVTVTATIIAIIITITITKALLEDRAGGELGVYLLSVHIIHYLSYSDYYMLLYGI